MLVFRLQLKFIFKLYIHNIYDAKARWIFATQNDVIVYSVHCVVYTVRLFIFIMRVIEVEV